MEYSIDLIEKNAAYLYAQAFRLTRNEADAKDLVQETFLRVIDKPFTVHEGSTTRAWLGTALKHRWLDDQKKRTVIRKFVIGCNFEAPIDSILCDMPVTAHQIRRALDMLPYKFREAISEHVLSEPSHDIESTELGVSCSTMAKRFQQAKKSLAGFLGMVESVKKNKIVFRKGLPQSF